MELNILVVNTNIIQGNDLKEIIRLAKDEYGCARIPSSNHYLLAVVHDRDLVDLQKELDYLNINNPAYEITKREIKNQTELEALSWVLYHEGR